jgi:hypothetical protein
VAGENQWVSLEGLTMKAKSEKPGVTLPGLPSPGLPLPKRLQLEPDQ